MTGTAHLPEPYRATLREGVAAALDAGIFYQDAFAAFVIDRIGARDPARDICLGIFEAPQAWGDSRQQDADLRARIAEAPRGTWLVRHHRNAEGTLSWFHPLMSDGSGRTQTRFDNYPTCPTYDAVYRRMAGYEVYLARNEIEAERSRATNLAVIAERKFVVGTTFRNLRIGQADYSTVTIIGLHPPVDGNSTIVGMDDRGQGWVTVKLIKRGSPRRYKTDLSAQQLARAVDAGLSARAKKPSPGGGHARYG